MTEENAFLKLLAKAKSSATRPFLARGSTVSRCSRCQLGEAWCICRWRPHRKIEMDIVLILHRDEIFKPTNTGRLIADVFPENTWAYEWSRTEPCQELLDLLEDDKRFCVVLFPGDSEKPCESKADIPVGKRLTLVILDGTWKQAGKMYRASEWLKPLKTFLLTAPGEGAYQVRKAVRSGQLSTAEAAASALQQLDENAAGQLLEDYFSVFQEHYVATRMNRPVVPGDSHRRLFS